MSFPQKPQTSADTGTEDAGSRSADASGMTEDQLTADG